MAHRIIAGNDFRLIVCAKRSMGAYITDMDLSEVDSLRIYMTRAGRSKELQSYTLDENGNAVIYVAAQQVTAGIYGIEMVGVYGDASLRAHLTTAFQIVGAGHGDAGVLTDYSVDIVFAINVAASDVFVKASIKAHNEDDTAHDGIKTTVASIAEDLATVQGDIIDLQAGLAEAGNVDDVQVDGQSILNQSTKIANINSSLFGKVDDVKVNGHSVVNNNKEANMTIPENVSELTNDSEYVTHTSLNTELAAKQDNISAVVSPEVVDNGGTPAAEVEFSQGQLSFTFKNLRMKFSDLTAQEKELLRGQPGASAVFDPDTGNILATLESGTGQSTANAMTQKAVTDEVFKTVSEIVLSNYTTTSNIFDTGSAIQWKTKKETSGNVVYGSGKLVSVKSWRGKSLRITPAEGKTATYCFPLTTAGSNNTAVSLASGTTLYTSENQIVVTVPDDAIYLWWKVINNGTNVEPTNIEKLSHLKTEIEESQADIEGIHENVSDLYEKNEIIAKEWAYADIANWTNQWNIDNDKWVSQTQYNGRYLVVTSYRGKTFRIKAQETLAAKYAFVTVKPTAAGQDVSYATGSALTTLAANKSVDVVVPDDALHLWVMYKNNGNNVRPQSVQVIKSLKETVIEVNKAQITEVHVNQSTGSDSNSGSSASSPLATMAKALEISGSDAVIYLHGDSTERVTISGKRHVTLIGEQGKRNRIIRGKKLTGLTAYQGFDDVYTWEPGEGESTPSGNYYWLWQHDILDSRTEIPIEERHPLQRYRTCRRLSTCLKHASSLEALLNADQPLWFVSGGLLYLRVVAGSDPETTNPIYIPNDTSAISCGSNVTLINIEAWYSPILISGAAKVEAYDCAARYSTGAGAWRIDDGVAAKFVRCEADSNTMEATNTGDGFNLHPENPSSIHAKGGTHTLIDCWGHDNRDDGYSDHGRSEGTIIGGLYEYNVKGGLTPSTGSNDTIIGAVCRGQNHGILYTGYDSGRNVGGSVQCIACVCYNNKVNYRVQGAASSGEYKTVMILERCTSRNAGTGSEEAGYSVGQNSTLFMHDCTHAGTGAAKFDNQSASDFDIQNGTVVS